MSSEEFWYNYQMSQYEHDFPIQYEHDRPKRIVFPREKKKNYVGEKNYYFYKIMGPVLHDSRSLLNEYTKF